MKLEVVPWERVSVALAASAVFSQLWLEEVMFVQLCGEARALISAALAWPSSIYFEFSVISMSSARSTLPIVQVVVTAGEIGPRLDRINGKWCRGG
jgi:hypothetical protein